MILKLGALIKIKIVERFDFELIFTGRLLKEYKCLENLNIKILFIIKINLIVKLNQKVNWNKKD